MQGFDINLPTSTQLGYLILNLTWFLSSLYLIYLYIMLYIKPQRGKPELNAIKMYCKKIILSKNYNINISFIIVLLAHNLISACLTNFGFYNYVDSTLLMNIFNIKYLIIESVLL